MPNRIFKTTLYRSNPHLIREFIIDDGMTIEDLLSTVAVVNGINTKSNIKLRKNTTVIGHSAIIKDMIPEEINDDIKWEIDIPVKGTSGRGAFVILSEEEQMWKFALEMVDSSDDIYKDYAELNDAKTPFFVRGRGLQIHERMYSVTDYNKIMEEVTNRGYFYDYRRGDISYDELMPDIDLINSQLERVGVATINDIKVNVDLGISIQSIIESYRVDDMKDCIRTYNLPINYQQKKANLVSSITRHYITDVFLQRVLKSMEYNEYLIFKEYVTSTHKGQQYRPDIPTLVNYLLTPRGYCTKYFPRELLEYYEQFLEKTGDEELIIEKQARTILNVAIELYGAFNSQIYKNLCDIAYKDSEDLDKIKGYWHKWKSYDGGYYDTTWKDTSHGFVCSRSVGYRNVFDKQLSDPIARNADNYYYPSQGEIFEIAINGLNYCKNSQEALANSMRFISSYYFDNDYILDVLIKKIYSIYRNGGSGKDIVREIRNYSYYYINESSFKEVAKLADSLIDEVRCYQYLGHTKSEYDTLKKEGKLKR